MYQLDHDFLTCDIAGVPLEYTVRADMWLSIHNHIIIIMTAKCSIHNYIIIIIMAATSFHYKLANIKMFM
jgi:hypothetical protein